MELQNTQNKDLLNIDETLIKIVSKLILIF